jgi:hypothetical protein
MYVGKYKTTYDRRITAEEVHKAVPVSFKKSNICNR